MLISRRSGGILALLPLIGTLIPMSVAHGAIYRFNISPTSGLSTTNASVNARTSGTLIGDWDPVTNPTGTRTKPGLFGTFGDTENVAVNTSINFSTSGAPSVPLGGSFRMGFDTTALTVGMNNYVSVNSGPATGALATSATVTTASFRTRNPTSTFPGGIPVTIPLGDATITSLSLTQSGPASGTLTPDGPNRFTFTVAPTVNVMMGVNLTGNDLSLGPTPIVLPMQGTVTFGSDGAATLGALAPVNVNDTTNPAEALPPVPFGLPTVFPPGLTANVIFNLTLDQLTTMIAGTVSTDAIGRIERQHTITIGQVPEPACAASCAIPIATLLLARRRR
jgi:hypothetical protein